MNIPNALSLARLVSAPAMVWLILGDAFAAGFWLFLFAGLTDAADGFVAKRFDAVTPLGQYLDPIADKVLVASVYVSLGYADSLPLWLVIMVVVRDALIVGGAILYQTITHALRMRHLAVSKVNTAAQIVLAAGVLADLGFGLSSTQSWVTVASYVVAATTLLSGAAYVVRWSRLAAVSSGE